MADSKRGPTQARFGIAALAMLAIGLTGIVALPEPADAAGCAITRGGKTGYRICNIPPENVVYEGRDHTFVVGTNRQIWHIFETTRGGGGPWSDWKSLGGYGRRNPEGDTITHTIFPRGINWASIRIRVWYDSTIGYRCREYNYPNKGTWTNWWDCA